VTVDSSTRYQTLVGFGAGVGYVEDELVQHPAKAALYDAMFLQLGVDIVRLTNRYDASGADLTSPAEIVGAAAERLARPPALLMTSASPPAALKANGDTWCGGNPDTCTLATLATGSFDYPGFADHWRASLDAYAAAGIEPDYLSIQNDADWVPPASDPLPACAFLPREGIATVNVNGSDVQVPYPGYVEALTAVKGALAGLASIPRIVAPETTGIESSVAFASELDLTAIDAIAHHMYGVDPSAVNHDALLALNDLGQQSRLPIFQTEMQSEGLDTAILMHEALSTIGASVYLQNDYLASANLSTNLTALIALSPTGFTIQDPYHALRHYARDTDPGWVRVAVASDQPNVLATAWLSPAGDALTVVLVNPQPSESVVELALGAMAASSMVVTRTVFSGVERFAELGALPADGTLTLPGESIVTVAGQK
jgi:glucuronoarabinoxylan endo-1,4-beta-xylanase